MATVTLYPNSTTAYVGSSQYTPSTAPGVGRDNGGTVYTGVWGFPGAGIPAGAVINGLTWYFQRADDYGNITLAWSFSWAASNSYAAPKTLLANVEGIPWLRNQWQSRGIGTTSLANLNSPFFVHVTRVGSTSNYSYGEMYLHNNAEGRAPYVVIDYELPFPAPQPPSIPGIGTITSGTPTISWSAGSDRVFPAGQLYYDVEFSQNSGSTWFGQTSSAQGVTNVTPNLKALLGLQETQYYYNAGFRIRVCTRTPDYNGNPYYSAWRESGVFAVDYRKPPSVPSSISVDNATPYEGQTINITIGRPAQYNAYDAEGNVMVLTYDAYLAATGLHAVTGAADVGAANKALAWTIGYLTSGNADLSTGIYGRVTDAEGQTSPISASTPITIKRFRAPVAIITKIDRDPTSATVYVRVPDTGFGGTQGVAQIQKLQYQKDGGGWVDASLSAWSGMDASFALTGLIENDRYLLEIRAINVPPSGTGLTAKTGGVYAVTMLEFSPGFFVFFDSVTGVAGAACKALIIGEDYSIAVPTGGLVLDGANAAGAWVDWTPAISGSGSMTYTGYTLQHARYKRIGKTLFIAIRAVSGTTGGTAENQLTFTLPTGLTPNTNLTSGSCRVDDTLSNIVGAAIVQTSGVVLVRRYDGANWGLGTGRGFTVDAAVELA